MNVIDIALDWLKKHSNEININVIAGIVASGIVLLLQGFVRTVSLILAAFITLKWRLRILWRIDKPNRIYVVSGAITAVNEYVKSAILAGPDAEAASTLIGTAGLLYPEAEIKHVYCSSFAKDFYKEHLIVVGGPVNNSCTAAALEYIKEHIYFNEDLQMVLPNQVFECTYDSTDHPIRDYGAVIRINNPFDYTKDIILAVGCDTHGVLAAALLISSRRDSKHFRRVLQKELGIRKYLGKQNFIAVVECEVLGNDIGISSIKYFSRLKNIY